MSIQTLVLRKSRECRIFHTYFTQFALPARYTFTSKGCFSVVLVACSPSLTRLAKAWRNLKRNAQCHECQDELGYSLPGINIYRVSSGYPNAEKRVENTTLFFFFYKIRGVWISDETLLKHCSIKTKAME